MRTTLKMCLVLALSLSIACVAAQTSPSRNGQSITKEQLKSMIGNPDVIILDVRPEQQWRAGELKIRGAMHENPIEVESWAHNYPKDKTLVLY
jgi:rhodanese-related sulfurtransferase